MRPQASEGEAQHGPFCWTGRFGHRRAGAGAAGVWVGTRFLASEEVSIHAEYQRRILAASESDTAYCENLFDGGWANAPHRVLRNSTVRDWEAAGRPPSGRRPGEGEIIARSPSRGQADRYRSYTPGPDTVDEIEPLSLWSGQVLRSFGKYSLPRDRSRNERRRQGHSQAGRSAMLIAIAG